MSKKTQKSYKRDKLLQEFVGTNCPRVETKEPHLLYEEYKRSLNEINCMIQHFQDLSDDEEVAFWRRLLMRTKMEMRELKQTIINMTEANIVAKEIAYS